MDTLLFASLMGLYYWFARLRLGYTFSAMLLQPVVVAVFVGLLLGNMPAAMIIGAGMQLVYLGVTQRQAAMCRQTRRWRPVSPFLSPLRPIWTRTWRLHWRFHLALSAYSSTSCVAR